MLYQAGMNTTQAIAAIEAQVPACTERDTILEFVKASTRGVVRA